MRPPSVAGVKSDVRNAAIQRTSRQLHEHPFIVWYGRIGCDLDPTVVSGRRDFANRPAFLREPHLVAPFIHLFVGKRYERIVLSDRYFTACTCGRYETPC